MRALLAAVLALGCAWVDPADTEILGLPGARPDAVAGAPTEASAELAASPRCLYLAVESELAPLVAAVASQYRDRYGVCLSLEAAPDGLEAVRVGLRDLAGSLGGQALSKTKCRGYDCNAPGSGVRVWIDAPYFERVTHTNQTAVESSIAHELGHVLSGWGRCYSGTQDREGHPEGGSVMASPADPEERWSAPDGDLVCSCGVCS